MKARWGENGFLVVDGFDSEDLSGGCWGEVAWLPAHHIIITDDDCNPPHRRENTTIGIYDGGGPDYDDVIGGEEPIDYFDVRVKDHGTSDDQLAAIVAVLEEIFAKYGEPIQKRALRGVEDEPWPYNPANDGLTADEWRDELYEAADMAGQYFPTDHERVLLTPVVEDLKEEPVLYEWLTQYLGSTQDEISSDDEPGGLGDEFVSRIYFRLLDEQIENASTEQIIGYRTASLEA